MSFLDTKIFLNSAISQASKGARYMTAYIKNYHFNNPMDRFQYIWIPTKHTTKKIRDKYDIDNITLNDRIHVEIRKGMYGLK